MNLGAQVFVIFDEAGNEGGQALGQQLVEAAPMQGRMGGAGQPGALEGAAQLVENVRHLIHAEMQ